MQNYITVLLVCSVTMSAIALFYIAIMPLLAKRYSVKGLYYAWLIVVIGLIIPFRPQFDNAIMKVSIPKKAVPMIQAGNGAPINIQAGSPILTPSTLTPAVRPPAMPTVSLWQAAAAIWLIGIAYFLAYQIIKHILFLRMARRWSEVIMNEQVLSLLQSLKSEMGIVKRIPLYRCSCIDSPMMIGVLNPRILLLATDLEIDEIRFILRHELVHYKRKDLWYKGMVLLATAVHWFNPVVYLMARSINVLCELSCDSEVVLNTDADTRRHYSEMIIGVARYQSKLRTALSTSFYGGKKGMKKRILSIMDMTKRKTGIAIICGVLFLSLFTGFVFAAAKTNLPASIPDETDLLSTSGQTENMLGKQSDESIFKGVTVKIESVIKNDKVTRINYSIQDEQNRLGEYVALRYWIKGNDYPDYSDAFKKEDGKLNGTLDVSSQDSFNSDSIELQIDQLRYNQLIGQTTRLDINLSELKTPLVQSMKDKGNLDYWMKEFEEILAIHPEYADAITENYNNYVYLQPDRYNYKLPIKSGEGDAWISNMGVVNNILHIQIKTLNPDEHDGIVAYDVQPNITDKNGVAVHLDTFGGFHTSGDGQINFSTVAVENPEYCYFEYVFDLGENNIADYELSFQSVPSIYLNGKWMVSFDSKSINESITRD